MRFSQNSKFLELRVEAAVRRASNCFQGYDTLDVIRRTSEKYLAVSHGKATWTKELCPCDFTQWEIVNFSLPSKWHGARVNLEATLWHNSENLFGSDIWNFILNCKLALRRAYFFTD